MGKLKKKYKSHAICCINHTRKNKNNKTKQNIKNKLFVKYVTAAQKFTI